MADTRTHACMCTHTQPCPPAWRLDLYLSYLSVFICSSPFLESCRLCNLLTTKGLGNGLAPMQFLLFHKNFKNQKNKTKQQPEASKKPTACQPCPLHTQGNQAFLRLALIQSAASSSSQICPHTFTPDLPFPAGSGFPPLAQGRLPLHLRDSPGLISPFWESRTGSVFTACTQFSTLPALAF